MAGKKKASQRPPKSEGKVTITKDGPLQVTGGVPLLSLEIVEDREGVSSHWREVKRYPPMEEYILCRCGKSKDQPFCDDSHAKIKFDGKLTAGHEPYRTGAEEIEGPELDLTDKKKLCTHARFCLRAGGIKNLTLNSDIIEARDIAIEEAGDCPSGRFVVYEKKKGTPIEPEFEPSVAVTENLLRREPGPLWVRGGIPVEGQDGEMFEIRNRVALCRCGKSRNKPFCDGSHLD